MGRSPCCDKNKVKRGSWSPEEDATLKDYLRKHGTGGNWIALPQKAGLKRCGKSCRLRWLNYLRPDIKHGAFSQEEEQIIFNLYNVLGSRWSVIASNLPGRTDNDVKNYWNTKLKKKLLAELSCSPTTSSTSSSVAAPASYTATTVNVPAAAAYTTATTTTTVEKTTTFPASMNSQAVVPTYSMPFPPDTTCCPSTISNGTISNDPNNSPTPQIILKDSYDQLNNYIICPYSQSHQESGTFKPSTLDEYSYEVLSGIWSPMEAIEVDRNADFAHHFPF